MTLPICRNGKVCYPSQKEADSIANLVCEKKYVPLTTYWCKWCKGWHLTRQNAKKKNRAKARAKQKEKKKIGYQLLRDTIGGGKY